MSKTDKQRLMDLLDEWDVVYKSEPFVVFVDAKTGPKNRGYQGFYAEFNFGPDGDFEYLGVWE